MAFLPSLGFLGFEIHIFYCNTPCLVWLPIQHRRKPISREPDFSVQKQGFLDGFLGVLCPLERRSPDAAWDANTVILVHAVKKDHFVITTPFFVPEFHIFSKLNIDFARYAG